MEVFLIIFFVFGFALLFICRYIKLAKEFTLKAQNLSDENLEQAIQYLLRLEGKKVSVKQALKLEAYSKEFFYRKRHSRKARF